MLNLVLGISGTGKTTLLYNKIKDRVLQGKRSILIVPEQFTSSTEARIYRELGDEFSGFVESFSFKSLAEEILTACGGVAIKNLSDAGRVVLVRRAFKELEGNLKYYYHQRKNAAFCQMVALTINELKSAGISAAKLSEIAPFCNSGKEKIAELALVFGAYEALLGVSGLDPSDRVNLAATRLETAVSLCTLPDFLRDREIFMDEFDTFNAPKKRLMSALFACVPAVTVALCSDNLGTQAKSNNLPSYVTEGTLFSGAHHIAYELRNLARKSGVSVSAPVILQEDIRHREKPVLSTVNTILTEEIAENVMFAQDELTLFGAQNIEDEVRTVTAQIQKLVREGASYSKIAVVCRDMDTYRTALRRAFRLSEIPLFCDETTTPEFCAPVTAIKALLSILRGVDFSDQWVTLAKTGLCAISEEEATDLENYVYTWSPSVRAWNEPFTRNPDGFESANFNRRLKPDDVEKETPLAERARLAMRPAINKFCKVAKNSTGEGITRAIYECLVELGAMDMQKTQVAALYKTQGILEAENATREWNVVMGLLDEMLALLSEEQISPTEYAELFGLLLRACDLGHIPQTLDAVIFTSAGKMRLDNPEYIFVLGVSEGEFPRSPSESGLLTHADRDAIMAQEIELPDCFENEMVREQVCFYKVLTAPAKGLFISWPAGKGLPHSSAIMGIVQQLNPKAPKISPLLFSATPAAALDRLGEIFGDDNTETASLYQALNETPNDEKLSNALNFIDSTAKNEQKQLKNLPQMQALLGDNINISPSKLEKYSACPYGYFLQYIIGLRPRQKAELSPNHSGNLMHWVLDKFLSPRPTDYDALKPCAFVDMSEDEISVIVNALTDEYQRLFMPEDSARFSYLMSRLKKSLVSLLLFLQEEQRQSAFKTTATEAKIGFDDGALKPQEYKLENGASVKIIGTIDRVDAWVDENGEKWVRVVDYKTGTKSFDLKEVYCGLDCQMLLYLFSLVRGKNGEYVGMKPAGVLYLLADPSPKESTRANTNRALRPSMEGLVADEKAVLTAMDEKGEGVFLPFAHAEGVKRTEQKKLASETKLSRIAEHLDGLVVDMASSLYSGKITAMPLCSSQQKPCLYCEFSAVCCHENGRSERLIADLVPKDPFEQTKDEEKTERQADE